MHTRSLLCLVTQAIGLFSSTAFLARHGRGWHATPFQIRSHSMQHGVQHGLQVKMNNVVPCGRHHTDLNMIFGKMFEESGPLGKGITVGKVQVSLNANDRSSSSIFGLLEKNARASGNSSPELAEMTNDVCLSLLRKSDDWTAACSDSKWFSENDAGQAESYFNELANTEAARFEKDYIPDSSNDENVGGATQVVVSIVIELQGDTTVFKGAGFSLAGTKEVLSSIASDCLVDDGYCVNAAEIFWTPSEREEVMTRRELIIDFPELIDL